MSIDASAVASVLGITTEYKNLQQGAILKLPQRIAVIAQGASSKTYATTPRRVFSALEAGQVYGFGSPIHLAVLQLLPTNGDGVGSLPVTVYPLTDHASGVAASGDITPSGTMTATKSYRARIGGIESDAFTLSTGATVANAVAALVAAINAKLEMPVIATDNASTSCDLVAKWDGATGNDIAIEVIGEAAGVTFAVTAMSAGATNPAVDSAIAQIGDVWETLILNGLDIADTTALDAYSTWGDGRWGALTRKPAVVFTGNTEADVTTAITVSDARKTDKTNSQLVAPGSDELPVVVAARQLARIAPLAQNNPPTDYASAPAATGIAPGTAAEQWDFTKRDAAVKGGSSTVEVKDGEIHLADVVTMYHPTGDPLPAYRHVVDIVKLQNIIYNLALIFEAKEWKGAPMIPDDQATVNPKARKPKAAKAAAGVMLDSLGLEAFISDPKTAKKNTIAAIDGSNPKRLNLAVPVQLSGNTGIIDVTLNFGFYTGTPALAA